MKNTSFLSKIISDLRSDRETRVSRDQDTIEISYPAISREDLKKNGFVIPFLLVFCLLMIFGAITTIAGIASTISGLPPQTPVEEKYILLVPILLQILFAVGMSAFIYQKMIRTLFVTEKLTLHPAYFIYSNGIWGRFKEIIRVKKEDLVAFAIGGNAIPILKFLSKGTDGENHLYVHYDKRKKKEIMGGRPDEEYMKMIDILEPYRASAGIYDLAVAVQEREKSKASGQSTANPKKKAGLITRIKTILGPESLDEKTCLKTNGILGLMMLPSIVFFILADNTKFPFPSGFLMVPVTAGTILAGGYLLAAANASLTKKILVLQGTLICLLVFIYTFFMWHVSQLIRSGKLKIGMGHAPGILAYGAAYGIKQVVNFSGLSETSGLARRLPVIFFAIGGCCDILVIYFIIKCFNP